MYMCVHIYVYIYIYICICQPRLGALTKAQEKTEEPGVKREPGR